MRGLRPLPGGEPVPARRRAGVARRMTCRRSRGGRPPPAGTRSPASGRASVAAGTAARRRLRPGGCAEPGRADAGPPGLPARRALLALYHAVAARPPTPTAATAPAVPGNGPAARRPALGGHRRRGGRRSTRRSWRRWPRAITSPESLLVHCARDAVRGGGLQRHDRPRVRRRHRRRRHPTRLGTTRRARTTVRRLRRRARLRGAGLPHRPRERRRVPPLPGRVVRAAGGRAPTRRSSPRTTAWTSPSTTWPRCSAARGMGFLGWNTRFRNNESWFLLEHALVDVGAGVRWLREEAGSRHRGPARQLRRGLAHGRVPVPGHGADASSRPRRRRAPCDAPSRPSSPATSTCRCRPIRGGPRSSPIGSTRR